MIRWILRLCQAIASLSPVQCKLLEYKVSSITEVCLVMIVERLMFVTASSCKLLEYKVSSITEVGVPSHCYCLMGVFGGL